jgi:hypothetical protein
LVILMLIGPITISRFLPSSARSTTALAKELRMD